MREREMKFSQLLNESNYLFEDTVKDLLKKVRNPKYLKDTLNKYDIQNAEIKEISLNDFNSKRVNDENYSAIVAIYKNGGFTTLDFNSRDSNRKDFTLIKKYIQEYGLDSIYAIENKTRYDISRKRQLARYNDSDTDYENGKLSAITNITDKYDKNRLRREMLQKLNMEKDLNEFGLRVKNWAQQFSTLYDIFLNDITNVKIVKAISKHIEKAEKLRNALQLGSPHNYFNSFAEDLEDLDKSVKDYKEKHPEMSEEEIYKKKLEYRFNRFKEFISRR